jgi:hypothetical protein
VGAGDPFCEHGFKSRAGQWLRLAVRKETDICMRGRGGGEEEDEAPDGGTEALVGRSSDSKEDERIMHAGWRLGCVLNLHQAPPLSHQHTSFIGCPAARRLFPS